jgi:hypothetical protein
MANHRRALPAVGGGAKWREEVRERQCSGEMPGFWKRIPRTWGIFTGFVDTKSHYVLILWMKESKSGDLISSLATGDDCTL